MSQWPTQQDYDVAITAERTRGTRIKGLTLRTYSSAEAKAKGISFLAGRPYTDRGAFAVVYQLSEKGNQSFVFRVFTSSGSSIGDLHKRYVAISELIKQWSNTWLVSVEWHSEGLLVDGQWKPAVLMERVDGIDLEKWLHENKADKVKLASIADQLRQMASDLERHNVAHGDLSHRNLMVSKAGQLKLVDYDGMYLPALRDIVPKENGLPGMQHPMRKVSSYGPKMDRFSVLVLYATLLYLKGRPNSLPTLCDDGLILHKKDFLDPSGSPLETMLRESDSELRKVSNAIVEAAKKNFSDTPTLEEVLKGASVAPHSISKSAAAKSPVPSYLQQDSIDPSIYTTAAKDSSHGPPASAPRQVQLKPSTPSQASSSAPGSPQYQNKSTSGSAASVQSSSPSTSTSSPSSPALTPRTSTPSKSSNGVWAVAIVVAALSGGWFYSKVIHRQPETVQTYSDPQSPPESSTADGSTAGFLRPNSTNETSLPQANSSTVASPGEAAFEATAKIYSQDDINEGSAVVIQYDAPNATKLEVFREYGNLSLGMLQSPTGGTWVSFCSRRTTFTLKATSTTGQVSTANVEVIPDASKVDTPERMKPGDPLSTSFDLVAVCNQNWDFENLKLDNDHPMDQWLAQMFRKADKVALRMFRNAVFASNGLIFKDPEITANCAGRVWYTPTTTDTSAVFQSLTTQQKKNIAYIEALEAKIQ